MLRHIWPVPVQQPTRRRKSRAEQDLRVNATTNLLTRCAAQTINVPRNIHCVHYRIGNGQSAAKTNWIHCFRFQSRSIVAVFFKAKGKQNAEIDIDSQFKLKLNQSNQYIRFRR